MVLIAVLEGDSRYGLAWTLANTVDQLFCLEATASPNRATLADASTPDPSRALGYSHIMA